MNFKYLKMFFYVNSFLVGLGSINYFCPFWINAFMRNVLITIFIWYGTRTKENISEFEQRKLCFMDTLYFTSTTALQTITELVITTNNYSNLLFFPLKLGLFEVLFDLMHYSVHYLQHRYFYKFHKVHHRYTHPQLINTFYHHPIDLLLIQCIPLIISFWLIPFSKYQSSLVLVYIDFIEISGHSGKRITSSCFPLFFWLPRLLGIDLYTDDHDLHHSTSTFNFSKRFNLWDRVFGTFKRKLK